MMGGGVLLFCLKAGHRRQECPKRVEAGLPVLLKILGEFGSEGQNRRLPPDMANSMKVVDFVIQFTVVAQEFAQCPAMKSREKSSIV